MKILLLSPYEAMSHRYWRRGLERMLAPHTVTTLGMADRHFSWRFRGNSLWYASLPELKEVWDLVIATSMTDLATLKGLAPALCGVPTIVYFHENQFAYPDRAAPSHLIERQITSLYSAMSADRLVFNSGFNLHSFIDGVEKLLARLPDYVPKEVAAGLQAKSQIINVALDHDVFQSTPGRSGRLALVWNHRWEYDKGTAVLAELVKDLLATTTDFVFHLIGQQFRKQPDDMQQIVSMLEKAGKLGVCGFVDKREDYLDLLASCDLVVSTARHEFQGLAILEAAALGCQPLVPDALAYQEFIPAACRYQSIEDAISQITRFNRTQTLTPDLGGLGESEIGPQWRLLLQTLTQQV